MSAGLDKKARTNERKMQRERAMLKRKGTKLAQKARKKAKRIARYEMRVNDPFRRKQTSRPYQ